MFAVGLAGVLVAGVEWPAGDLLSGAGRGVMAAADDAVRGLTTILFSQSRAASEPSHAARVETSVPALAPASVPAARATPASRTTAPATAAGTTTSAPTSPPRATPTVPASATRAPATAAAATPATSAGAPTPVPVAAPVATPAPRVPAPSIQIRSPLTDQTYSGTIAVQASATDVSTVTYRVGTSSEVPLTYDQGARLWVGSLSSSALTNGAYDVTVTGIGTNGSRIEDRAWRVQINNAVATPKPAPTNAPVAAQGAKVFGVNVNGGEFGEQNLPGTSNTDYVYPSELARQTYLAGKGLTLVRLPFRWERVQRASPGALHPDDVAGIRSVLDAARGAGQLVILDLHNYGRYYGAPLTRADAPRFADVWSRLAAEFRGHPALFGYELMNEPHDLPEGSESWAFLSQAATDAIRLQDKAAWILVPGYGWQTARYWPENNATLSVSDPSGKVLYAAHQYFDADYTGVYARSYDADKTYPTIGVDRVRPFLDWLAARNARGIFTEYGVPDNDARWLDVLDSFLSALDADARIAGGTCWASGPWWGTYPLSVEPRSGVDRPQMGVLTRHRTRG